MKTDRQSLKIAIKESKEIIDVPRATGHFGNVLLRELITLGQTVRALVFPDEACRPLTGPEVQIVRGDITDLKSPESVFVGVDVVTIGLLRLLILPG